MGRCIYCGQDAGLFFSKHKECEEKHATALAELNSRIKDYFKGGTDASSIGSALQALSRTSFINKDDAIMLAGKEIENFCQSLCYPVTDSAMRIVQDLIVALNIKASEINAYNGALRNMKQKYAQSSVLQQLSQGILPPPTPTKALLGRNEHLLWTYNGVKMLQEKVEKEYFGKRSGWSYRIAKGLTYHSGGTKLKPIEHSYMKEEGIGSLYITDMNLIFQSNTSAIKVPYKKMVGITPYSDGAEVHRDGTNAKRLVFQGFDGDFLMNILYNIQK